ncbi:glycosyltransferase [Clostridium bornimense]|uniref:glycosyltransferase family 2 protein n=1 Tax=Clostridium bornimense TaxID=1216932 RepID=UPI001C0F6DAB|nr:glycosyltransferase family 2 protein [Clostridium bornimense]MBU5315062.1 glycosyltransferase [Clostridium bornimense]
MCEISIIIPVFNTERYIEKCFQSAIHQTFKSIEIIIIDDGSTDKSLEIINLFKKKYSFINVIVQKNSGQGEARNNGIKRARGRYITFLDSDDWLEDKCLEEMYSDAIKYDADIVVCNIKKVYEVNSKEICMPQFTKEELSKYDVLKEILKDDEIKSYPCAKLFKRELFIKNNIFFPKNMYYEDLAIGIKLFYYSNKVILSNYYGYYYLQRSDSTTRKISNKNVFDRLNALCMIKKFLKEKEIFIRYRKEYIRLCIFHLNLIIHQIEDCKLDISYESVIEKTSMLIECELTSKDINNSRLRKKDKLKLNIFLANRKIYTKYMDFKKKR